MPAAHAADQGRRAPASTAPRWCCTAPTTTRRSRRRWRRREAEGLHVHPRLRRRRGHRRAGHHRPRAASSRTRTSRWWWCPSAAAGSSPASPCAIKETNPRVRSHRRADGARCPSMKRAVAEAGAVMVAGRGARSPTASRCGAPGERTLPRGAQVRRRDRDRRRGGDRQRDPACCSSARRPWPRARARRRLAALVQRQDPA